VDLSLKKPLSFISPYLKNVLNSYQFLIIYLHTWHNNVEKRLFRHPRHNMSQGTKYHHWHQGIYIYNIALVIPIMVGIIADVEYFSC